MSSRTHRNPESESADARPTSTSPSRVCVVDGDERVRKRIESILTALHVNVAQFSSAEELIASAMSDGADCVIADIELPGMSGIELKRKLRDSGNACPVILVSHDGSIATAVAAMQVGAFDFVRKPFRNQVILRTVASALNSGINDSSVDTTATASGE